MAVSAGTIRASLILQDRMTGPLKAAGQAAHKFGTKMTAMGATMSKVGASMQATGMMMSMALTLPLTLLGGAAAKTFAQFEQGMNKVRAVTGLDKVSAEFQQLQEQAEELGRTTVFSAVQASEAMGAFGLAGFKANEILGAMPGALQLAAAGQLAVGDAASITAKIMRGYGLEITEVARMNDVLTKAFTTSNTDLVGLGEAFKMAGPVANVAGLQFEETAAALSLMADAGFQGTMGGTALRGAISRLAGAVPAVAKQLKNMGIVTLDSNKQLLPMADILKQLETRGLSTGEIMQLFGQRAGPAMAALLERGSDALVTMTKSLEDAGGTAERIARVQLEGLMGQWTLLKSAVEGVKIAMGEQLAPALTGLLANLTAFSGYLTNVALPAFAALPTSIQQTTIAVLALAVAFGPLTTIAGVLLRGFGPLVSAGGLLAKTFGNLSVRGASLTKTYKLFTTILLNVGKLFTRFNVITGVAVTATLAVNAAIKKLTGGSHSLWSVLGDVSTIVIELTRRFARWVGSGIKIVIEWFKTLFNVTAALIGKWTWLNETLRTFGGWLTQVFDGLDKTANEMKATARAEEQLTDAVEDGANAAQALASEVDTVAVATEAIIESETQAYIENARAQMAAAVATDQVAESSETLVEELDKLPPVLESTALGTGHLWKKFNAIQRHPIDKKIADLGKKFDTQATVQIPTFTSAISSVGTAFSNLATVSGAEMGKIWKKLGTFVTKIQTVTTAVGAVKTAFKNVNSFFAGGGWSKVTGMMSGLRTTIGGASGSGGLIGDVGGVGSGAVTAGPQAATAFAGFTTVIGVGAAAAALLVSTWKSADELANRYAARIAAMGPEGLRLAALATARKAAVGPWGTGSTEYTGEGMQHGGIVTSPTVKLLGEAGPEAVIPLDQMGNEALLGEMRGLRAELRLLPLHLRDAIILAT